MAYSVKGEKEEDLRIKHGLESGCSKWKVEFIINQRLLLMVLVSNRVLIDAPEVYCFVVMSALPNYSTLFMNCFFICFMHLGPYTSADLHCFNKVCILFGDVSRSPAIRSPGTLPKCLTNLCI
jgi:hypothetical protein